MKRAVIFANGNLSDLQKAKKNITKEDFFICADGAVSYIFKLGFSPDLVIGDFDSISKKDLEQIKQKKIQRLKYPRKKNETDFELAVNEALEKGFEEILIFGFMGDRLDHLTANILFLARIKKDNKKINLKIIEGKKEMYVIDRKLVLKGKKGDLVSIIPLIGNTEGISTKGLEYKLLNESLNLGFTRGVSNVMKDPFAKIYLKKGIVLIVHFAS
jgi:thiamine pyrophosphokinase